MLVEIIGFVVETMSAPSYKNMVSVEENEQGAAMVNIKSKDDDPLIPTKAHKDGENHIDNDRQLNHKCKSYLIIIILIFIIIGIGIGIIVYILNETDENDDHWKFDRYLIVISLDGFRADYLDNKNISTPNLDLLAQTGVHIKRLIPVYPSLTFPNHYTIATGLYPGDHGIVSNSFYDPELDEIFFMSSKDETGKWYRGEPIWNTHRIKENKDNNKYNDFKSGVVYWVGSDHNASGHGYPEWYLDYNISFPFKKRINTILDLLKDGSYRLIMGYLEQPDKYGHDFGPDSNQVVDIINIVDNYIGDLINGIKNIDEKLYQKTDIIILSDHGMTNVSNKSLIHIDSSIDFNLSDTNNFILDSVSSNLFIKRTDESNFTINEIKDGLKNILYPIDLCDIYDQSDIPFIEYSNNGYNDRVPDIIVIPSNGYQFILDDIPISDQYSLNLKGNHGFNNSWIPMSSLFVASGPSFKSGYIKNYTHNIHLYELFCYLMDEMVPSPNNGSFEQIRDILIDF